MSKESKPPAPAVAPNGAACWICLEEGPDETSEPLVRNCACRGDSAGFAHLSCITQYAKSRLNNALKEYERDGACNFPGAADEFMFCDNCKNKYKGELCLSLIDELVKSTEHLPESHNIRMVALYSSASVFLHEKAYARAIEIYELLTSCTWWPVQVESLIRLGEAYKKQRKFSEALEWYEKARGHIVDDASQSATEKYTTRTKQDVDFEIESLKIQLGMISIEPSNEVERQRRNFQRIINQNGEDSAKAKTAVFNLILALVCDNKHLEALKLCKRAIENNERVFGPNHIITLKSRDCLAKVKQLYRLYLDGIANK